MGDSGTRVMDDAEGFKVRVGLDWSCSGVALPDMPDQPPGRSWPEPHTAVERLSRCQRRDRRDCGPLRSAHEPLR